MPRSPCAAWEETKLSQLPLLLLWLKQAHVVLGRLGCKSQVILELVLCD